MPPSKNPRREKAEEFQAVVGELATVEQSATLKALNIDPATYSAAAQEAIMRVPDIVNCTPLSFANCMRKCIASGLLPDGVNAAIIPFKDKATFIPMKDGLARILREATGATINCGVFREGDDFDYEEGTNPFVRCKQDLKSDGDIIGAWATCKLPDGTTHVKVLRREYLNRIRDASAAKSGPWAKWPEPMCAKSALKSLINDIKHLISHNHHQGRAMAAVQGDDEHSDDTKAIDVTPASSGTDEWMEQYENAKDAGETQAIDFGSDDKPQQSPQGNF